MSSSPGTGQRRRSITESGPVVIDDRYKLITKIGSGGTAEVWKAKHTIGDFECAVKIMHMSRKTFKLCREEFRLLSNVYHPNIVRTFDMGFIEDTHQAYLSMEFISGSSWGELRTEKRPSGRAALEWLTQIVSVLRYLHSFNIPIVHKDIKPDNIVVAGRRAVLIDFNIASTTDPNWGTVAYKCPSVSAHHRWSRYADVWALAVSFYELATGVELFSGGTSFSAELNHERDIDVPDCVWSAIVGIISGAGQDTEPAKYAELFGMAELRERRSGLPPEIAKRFSITSKRQIFLARSMLVQKDARKSVSKSVISRAALKSAGLPASASELARLRAVFSQLKSKGVVEYTGKGGAKARLAEAFISAVERHQAS